MSRLGSLVLLLACLVLADPPPGSASPGPSSPLTATPGHVPARSGGTGEPARALGLLHRWDRARAAAYAAGSAPALRRLYTPGSSAGRADVRLLRTYAARGLRRVHLGTQVFAARVLRAVPGRVDLRVVERSYGSAVGPRRCVRLPTSAPVTRTVSLRARTQRSHTQRISHRSGATARMSWGAGWRVAAVSGAVPGVASGATPAAVP